MSARLAVVLSLGLTASILGAQPSSPAVVAYPIAGQFPAELPNVVHPFILEGPGYTFTTDRTRLAVTALSWFNADWFGGGSSLGPTLGCPTCPERRKVVLGREHAGSWYPIAQATIDASSTTWRPGAGLEGAFWSTTLAEPVALQAGVNYVVFGGTRDLPGQVPVMIPSEYLSIPREPITDSRIQFVRGVLASVDEPLIPGLGGIAEITLTATDLAIPSASLEIATIPEPGTVALVGGGLVALLGAVRASRRRGPTT